MAEMPETIKKEVDGRVQVKPFDPEGSDYDYATAESAGMKPDETGHWSSREPKSGQILKGRKHETFHKTEAGEAAAGMEIYKGDAGKYYSRPKEGRDMGEAGKKWTDTFK